MSQSNNKIKVAFVSIFSYPLFNPECDLTFGGAEVQISLISKELAKDKDFDVNVVVADTGQEKVEHYEGVKVIKTYKRGRGILNLVKAPIQLYRTLRKIDPDIVVCRSAGVEVGITGFYAKMNRKKFVYSVASNGDIDGEYSRGIRGRSYQYGFNGADIYIAQSKDQLEMLGERKKTLIKNSFSDKSVSTHKREFILWVGRAGKVKRPEYFLRLTTDFPKEDFTMIMPKSEEGLWEKIEEKAKQISNLKLIEKVPFGEIDRYFENAKVFVNTSLHEGFANTFIQSSVNGVPILSLKVNPDNFLNNYNCGIACDDEYEKFKSGLRKLLDDEQYHQKLSSNSKKYFKTNHDIINNIIEWKKILKEK